MKVAGAIEIDREPAEVFNFLSDPTNISKLPGGGDHVEWTSNPPHGLGSTFQFDARISRFTLSSQAEVTAWQPPTCYSRKATNGLLTAEFVFELEEHNGSTRLICRGNMKFPLILAAVALPFRSLINRRFAADLRAIKALLESQAQR